MPENFMESKFMYSTSTNYNASYFIKNMLSNSDKNRFSPKKVIFNNPATIVFWNDGTKTVVKCQKDTEFNPYYGFCAALAKKIFGTNSEVNRIVRNGELSF